MNVGKLSDVKWVTDLPTQEGYYWIYENDHHYVVYMQKHPFFPECWQMAFGGPSNLVNGGKYIVKAGDAEDPGVYRSAEPIQLPEPPLVPPI